MKSPNVLMLLLATVGLISPGSGEPEETENVTVRLKGMSASPEPAILDFGPSRVDPSTNTSVVFLDHYIASVSALSVSVSLGA